MVLCRGKGLKGSGDMAIISNNRPFKGTEGAEKIHSGTDDGIMSTGSFPFDFYYNGSNIKNGVRFSGNTFAYLTPNLNDEELRVNRRDAVCNGLYREEHEDYLRIAWIGYSHYSASNQTDANRLEWEVYFFKGTSIIEVVIGKSPQTPGSIDYFDTKGEEVFNGPFVAGCSYVFEGDEQGKNHVVHINSHYKELDYLERDIAVIGQDGKEKKVYPTTIASNTLVEQEDGTVKKLSDVLKNLKGSGGGDYDFLPVYPNDYLTFSALFEYQHSSRLFNKTIQPIYWANNGTIRFVNHSNHCGYFELDCETGAVTLIKSYDSSQEREALRRLEAHSTCTVVQEQRLYAFSSVSSTNGLAIVEIDLVTGDILYEALDASKEYDRTYKSGVYCSQNHCIYLVGTSYQYPTTTLHCAIYNTTTKQIVSERDVYLSNDKTTKLLMQTNYRNLTRGIFTESEEVGVFKVTVFGVFTSAYFQVCEIIMSHDESYRVNESTRNIAPASDFHYGYDEVFFDTERNVLTIFRGETASHTSKYDEYTITQESSSDMIANSKNSLLNKLPYRTIDECEVVQTPKGLFLIGGMVWNGDTATSHKKIMLYKNRKSPLNRSTVESQAKRINPFISCSTNDRPFVEDIGFQIYDTDLKTPMWWDGEQWNAGLMTGNPVPPEDDDDDNDGENGPEYHMYRADIHSTNGTIFRNGEVMTVLQARLYDFDRNITKELHPSQYKWTRVSKDEAADMIWDNQHSEGSYEIEITASDVRLRAVFYLDVVDENGYSILSDQVST